MTENVEHDILWKSYLLGELAESRQQELEEQLMTGNECFEQLSIAEDKLVDEYLRGSLSGCEEERFRDHFLCTPERIHRVRFSRSLHKYVLTTRGHARTLWEWPKFFALQRPAHRFVECSLAAALSLIVLGGSWLTFRIHHLEGLLHQVRSQPA